jgi:cellulose synthase/poly-beta-1,6-N-acetylglucosamine synthase-like glycosyltransferase
VNAAWAAWVALAVGTTGCALVTLAFLTGRKEIAALVRLTPAPLDPATPLLVIIPARNEAHGIGTCLRRVLADRSPELRVVVVDDRSNDETPRIVAALAAGDPRLSLLSLTDDPAPGTFGKPRALARALDHARSMAPLPPRVLFLDADVMLEAGALGALVVAHEAHAKNGALTGLPKLTHGTTLERFVMPTLVPVLVRSFGPRSVHAGQTAFLNGQCILIDTFALNGVGGFPVDTVLEDVALARRLHAVGHPLRIADLRALASTRMYASWRGIVDGFGKNAVALMGPHAWAIGALALLTSLLPWTGVALASSTGDMRVIGAAVALLLVTMAMQLAARTLTRAPKWPILVLPVAYALVAYVLTRASWRAWRKQPVTWKGRTYPSS